MRDARWRNPEVPALGALLLLPSLPTQARITQDQDRWSGACRSWSVATGQGPTEAELVLGGARAAARSGARLVLVDGRDHTRHLARAGYRVRTYTASWAGAGAVTLSPLGEAAPAAGTGAGSRSAVRRALVAGVRRSSGRRYVTVASLGSVTPAAVRAAVGSDDCTASLVTGGGGPRRRHVFLVATDRSSRPARVVKVAPLSGQARGVREQQALRRLHEHGLGAGVPRPLGLGVLDRTCWSSETAVSGQPLTDVLSRRAHPPAVLPVLEELVTWFGDVGAVTRARRAWGGRKDGALLRGRHRSAGALYADLQDVPGVLVHGDVGSGLNVLLAVDGAHVIDWETSQESGLPLVDVLPMVCLALAALRDQRGAQTAPFVLRLCAGLEPDSPWLHRLVTAYCARLGVPLDQAGALATLAWAYQASMRAVHEELLVEQGAVATDWESPAEQVADSWPMRAGLGVRWTALAEGRQ